MAYESLKNSIDAYIRQNGVQAITGDLLNGVLNAMVTALGHGYQYLGVAASSTAAPSGDGAYFFLASAGSYPSFGDITVPDGSIGIIRGTGGSWSLETISLGNFLTNTEASETYQTINDEALKTEDKTVPGAINEVNGIAKNAVLVTEQTLTDAQQEQVQTNIGAQARIDNRLQTGSSDIAEAINENYGKVEPLSSLLENTENIFNKINSLTDVKLYWKSTEKKFVVKTSVESDIYIIKILDSVKVADKYEFKVFNEHSLEEDNIITLTLLNTNGPAAIDTVGITSSNSKEEKRGYFSSCEYDGYLYLYIQFDETSDTSTHKAIVKSIIDNLIVVKGDPWTVGYPTEYAPYYTTIDVPKDLNKETSSSTIKLFLVDKDGNKMGDGVEFNVSGGTSEAIDPTKLNVVDSITYKLESSVLSDSNVIIGTGWSGNLSEGFTHVSGSIDPLQFSLPGIAVGDRLIITFDSTGITGENTDIRISIGDSAQIKTYNGGSSFQIGTIYQNGNLTLTPVSGFNGVVTNLKCRKISDTGTEDITIGVNDVFCQQNSLVAGFWNIIIGSRTATMSKMMYGTRNVSLGYNSLNSMEVGNRNVAIGTFSMPFLTRGENNVAIGSDTIYPLVEADNCVGIGKQTLGGNKTATDCVAVGAGALGSYSFSKDRSRCVGVGVNAAPQASENCTHVGYRAGANVLGANNTSIGYNAMAVGERSTADIVGTELTCIGYKSEIANTDEAKAAVNSTAIGANTTITKSNQVIIGNSSVEEVLIAGKKIIFHEDGTVTWETIS